jgi:hypothetical protein
LVVVEKYVVNRIVKVLAYVERVNQRSKITVDEIVIDGHIARRIRIGIVFISFPEFIKQIIRKLFV